MTTTLTRARTIAAARTSDREIVDALRLRVQERKANQPAVPQLAQVQTVVGDLIEGTSLPETAAKMGITDQAAAERMVFDIVATFGTWLSHSIGRAEVDYTYAADDIQMSLFATPKTGDGRIVVPAGYEPSGPHRRDVDKALCTIVHYQPDNEVISRFVARTYAPRQSKLSYPVIAGVWGFAQRGRLDTIDKVSDDLIFQSQVIEAFEVLDVARQDAVDAVTELRSSSGVEPAAVVRACDRAFWIDESFIRNLRHVAETVAEATPREQEELMRASDRLGLALKRLQRELENLDRRCQAAPDRYLPGQVSDLTLGQVRRICQNAGFRVDPESRSEETEIRNVLRSMGFGGDADRLIPEALRCAEMGLLDNFWSVMQARQEGDPTWAVQLQELAAD